MIRTLRGVWSRRWTLLPLLLLTLVVVAGTVTVVSFAEAAGTSRLLALPLLLLGLVAVPGTARELAAARRGEVALARLRGLQGGELSTLLSAEPLVVLLLGGLAGVGVGVLGGRWAGSAWVGHPGHVGVAAPLAGLAIVVVGLVAVVVGIAGSLNEPLVQQVSVATRPRAASVVAIFGSVLVLVAAVVASYRSSVDASDPDWVVLAGPALVGLAVGEVVVWLLRLAARAAVPATTRRGMGGFLAVRRLARVPDAVTALRLLIAAAVVGALAVTGAQQVSAWTDDTAKLRAGGPLQVVLKADAPTALDATEKLDPSGKYLMAAVLVPGTGAIPNRRAFLDTSRYQRVLGDFYAGTPAAAISATIGKLGGSDTGLAVGSTVTATVQGISRRDAGQLHPQILLAYRDDNGRPTQVRINTEIGLDGAPVTATAPLTDCVRGCVVTQLSFLHHHGDANLPWLLSRLTVGNLDAVHLDWQPNTPVFPGGPPRGPYVVDGGLMATPGRGQQSIEPASAEAGHTPILATRSAQWTDSPVQVESPGGDDRPAQVLGRYDALPLVEADGILADLPRSLAGAPPTVPAAVVMVLARADTPPSMLAGLKSLEKGPPRTLADQRRAVATESRSAQSRMYLLMAGCCLLVALLVLATATARQRRSWLHDLAALRVVGIGAQLLRSAGRWEVVGLAGAAVVGTVVGAVLAVRLLLSHLPLVTVPDHAVPLHADLTLWPLVVAGVATALIVVVVGGRGRTVGDRASRPSILREDSS